MVGHLQLYWFPGILLLLGAFGLGSAWAVYFVLRWWSPSVEGPTQGRRYRAALCGVATSAMSLGMLLWSYDISQVRFDISALSHTPTYFVWTSIGLHVATIVVCALAAVWFTLRPVGYVKPVHGYNSRPYRSTRVRSNMK